MRKSLCSSAKCVGNRPHRLGAFAPAAIALAASSMIACGGDDSITLEPIVLGMTSDMAPAYMSDDGEDAYYEAKLPVQLPVLAPTPEDLAELQAAMAPYPTEPYVKAEDIDVQVTWTLTNLDPGTHRVHLLVDPWNEFNKYWPGQAQVDEDEALPNLSGIQSYFELPGTDHAELESRVHGTLTFDDMQELAIDFSTVMNIIQNVVAITDPMDPNFGQGGPLPLVNHAFSFRNLSHRDLLVEQYIPPVIAGLTGFDIGIRTEQPANIALEIVIELTDKGKNRLPRDNQFDCEAGVCQWTGREGRDLLPEPADYITAGN